MRGEAFLCRLVSPDVLEFGVTAGACTCPTAGEACHRRQMHAPRPPTGHDGIETIPTLPLHWGEWVPRARQGYRSSAIRTIAWANRSPW